MPQGQNQNGNRSQGRLETALKERWVEDLLPKVETSANFNVLPSAALRLPSNIRVIVVTVACVHTHVKLVNDCSHAKVRLASIESIPNWPTYCILKKKKTIYSLLCHARLNLQANLLFQQGPERLNRTQPIPDTMYLQRISIWQIRSITYRINCISARRQRTRTPSGRNTLAITMAIWEWFNRGCIMSTLRFAMRIATMRTDLSYITRTSRSSIAWTRCQRIWRNYTPATPVDSFSWRRTSRYSWDLC